MVLIYCKLKWLSTFLSIFYERVYPKDMGRKGENFAHAEEMLTAAVKNTIMR
jgi:hypothetical protein